LEVTDPGIERLGRPVGVLDQVCPEALPVPLGEVATREPVVEFVDDLLRGVRRQVPVHVGTRRRGSRIALALGAGTCLDDQPSLTFDSYSTIVDVPAGERDEILADELGE
jgi:hypothetical protein